MSGEVRAPLLGPTAAPPSLTLSGSSAGGMVAVMPVAGCLPPPGGSSPPSGGVVALAIRSASDAGGLAAAPSALPSGPPPLASNPGVSAEGAGRRGSEFYSSKYEELVARVNEDVPTPDSSAEVETRTLKDKSVCKGQFDAKGLPISYVEIDYPEGDPQNKLKYVGFCEHGVPHGLGLLKFRDGNCYRGEFRGGKFHGKGIFAGKVGAIEVDFELGEANGKGIRAYPKGEVYEIEFVLGKAVRTRRVHVQISETNKSNGCCKGCCEVM